MQRQTVTSSCFWTEAEGFAMGCDRNDCSWDAGSSPYPNRPELAVVPNKSILQPHHDTPAICAIKIIIKVYQAAHNCQLCGKTQHNGSQPTQLYEPTTELPNYAVILLIKLILLTTLFIACHELFRRGGFWLGIAVFCLLPVLLTPWWMEGNPQFGLFPWVKLYSVLFTLTWATFARFTKLGRKTWWRQGVACLLIINIFEAIVQDASNSQLAHWLVVVSGILLVVTLPSFRHSIQIDLPSSHQDLIFNGMDRKWIIEYTIWNAAFVYLNFPAIIGHQLAVLLAAALIGLKNPVLWLQARGYTLGTSLLLLVSFPQFMISFTNTENWSDPYRDYLVSATCLIIMLGYFFRFVQLQMQKLSTQY